MKTQLGKRKRKRKQNDEKQSRSFCCLVFTETYYFYLVFNAKNLRDFFNILASPGVCVDVSCSSRSFSR